MGYIGVHRSCNTADYGLPQRRWRVWLVYHRVGLADMDILLKCMQIFRCDAASVSMFVMEDSVPVFELPRQAFNLETLHNLMKLHKERRWPQKLQDFIEKHALSTESLSWAMQCLERCPAFHGLRARGQTVLIARYAYLKQVRNVDATATRVIFQYDQSVDRCPTGFGQVPCVCPKGRYWDSLLKRSLHAVEHAALQGIGKEEIALFGLENVPSALLADLIGNSFSGNVCAIVVLSTLAAWKR